RCVRLDLAEQRCDSIYRRGDVVRGKVFETLVDVLLNNPSPRIRQAFDVLMRHSDRVDPQIMADARSQKIIRRALSQDPEVLSRFRSWMRLVFRGKERELRQLHMKRLATDGLRECVRDRIRTCYKVHTVIRPETLDRNVTGPSVCSVCCKRVCDPSEPLQIFPNGHCVHTHCLQDPRVEQVRMFPPLAGYLSLWENDIEKGIRHQK
ncbi:hypothetical protein KIPB_008973, partial [Kipferlia bialata]